MNEEERSVGGERENTFGCERARVWIYIHTCACVCVSLYLLAYPCVCSFLCLPAVAHISFGVSYCYLGFNIYSHDWITFLHRFERFHWSAYSAVNYLIITV